jgi:hypothetical protein
MADPLSIAAIAGLIFAARKFSETSEDVQLEQNGEKYQIETQERDFNNIDEFNRSVLTNTLSGSIGDRPGLGGHGIREFNKEIQPSFGDVGFINYTNGEPVHDFRNRPYVSNQMNNFSPAEKELVGSGLGVGPDVPAYGGYQQVFRVKPNNVGAYKLTTLPGRAGPAADVSGGRRAAVGELTHHAPEKTAYLPERRPTLPGRAQGQGGALSGVTVRQEYEKSKITTNRSETTLRQDGLEFNPAQKFVPLGSVSDEPTRNKGDLNNKEFAYNNRPAPGISNFKGGYTNDPMSKFLESNDKNFAEFGIRETNRRGKNDREGNPGRMNVRGDALNQGGLVTAVKSDSSRVDGRTGPANGSSGGRMQNYVNDTYYQFNAFKGNKNPHASSNGLDIAKGQLDNNPFAHSLSN